MKCVKSRYLMSFRHSIYFFLSLGFVWKFANSDLGFWRRNGMVSYIYFRADILILVIYHYNRRGAFFFFYVVCTFYTVRLYWILNLEYKWPIGVKTTHKHFTLFVAVDFFFYSTFRWLVHEVYFFTFAYSFNVCVVCVTTWIFAYYYIWFLFLFFGFTFFPVTLHNFVYKQILVGNKMNFCLRNASHTNQMMMNFVLQPINHNSGLPLTFEFLSGPFYARLDRLQFPETFLLPHIDPIHDAGNASPIHNFLHPPPILYRIFPFFFAFFNFNYVPDTEISILFFGLWFLK